MHPYETVSVPSNIDTLFTVITRQENCGIVQLCEELFISDIYVSCQLATSAGCSY